MEKKLNTIKAISKCWKKKTLKNSQTQKPLTWFNKRKRITIFNLNRGKNKIETFIDPVRKTNIRTTKNYSCSQFTLEKQKKNKIKNIILAITSSNKLNEKENT